MIVSVTDALSDTGRMGPSSYRAVMTRKSVGTMLALVDASVLVGGVVLLVTRPQTDDTSGSSIAGFGTRGPEKQPDGTLLRRHGQQAALPVVWMLSQRRLGACSDA
jgi:hypothetical protein